jgi:outer membrane protein
MKSSSFKAGIVRFAAVAALMLAAAAGVQAQELKIGFVNSDRVLREATLAKAAQSRLETEFSKRQKEGEDAAAKLKASEADRNRRQKDLVDQDRELQRKRREFQEDLNQRKNEELASVVERANKVVKQIYDTEKFDLILQGDVVIFASARVDITDKVIKALNAQTAAK